MKSYTDKQLLDKVKTLKSFTGIPTDYWILGVQSNADSFNSYDDKFYLFKGEKFIMSTTGTTNSGSTGLLQYTKYNKVGVAVVPTNTWFYCMWSYGLHNGKMKALRQLNPIELYRDGDKDQKVEEVNKQAKALVGINFHTCSYEKTTNYIATSIGGWSVGCQVCNNVDHYYKIIDLVKNQSSVTYCLLKEF